MNLVLSFQLCKKTMIEKRKVEIVVISDVHLGTYGCKAKELVNYLERIQPKILVLNGDIIDIWQFSKHYFPETHMRVIKTITSMLANGTEVHYITGNHDEMLRKFKGFQLSNFKIVNKLVLPLKTGKAWFFHGDVFDNTMKHSKWIAKLGGKGYDLLIMINNVVNWVSTRLGKGRISLSKKVKDSVKGVSNFVSWFEETASEIAIENGYKYVICGHIHQPKIKNHMSKSGEQVTYLNSGDWVENMTALEYNKGKWVIYQHRFLENNIALVKRESSLNEALNYENLFNEVIKMN
jgi:UDP-2,3-diacylglucosamine pyrophosphatase LpxH